jgi:carbamoyl-phosphate synthase large subunit
MLSGMPARKRVTGPLTLLFTCVGRRVELLQAFRAAARRLGQELRIVGVDSDPTAPGLFCADEPRLAPRADEAGYIAALADAVRACGAQALIPTTDTDLRVISENRAAFAAAGCTALIAEPQVIEICRNKLLTYDFLRRHGIDTPETLTPEQVRAGAVLPAFPLFCKPLRGSASQRVNVIRDALDLDYFLRRHADLIVQEFVAGQEYTLDVYVGLDGVPRCVVPRARWQVRTGEVSKGVVVKDPEIMNAGKRVVEALGPSPRGLLNLQCIVTPERRIRFVEINPRFGGGAPMAIAAGADYPAWLIQELRGERPEIAFDGFRHGVCMLRYDWSVFVPLGDDLKPRMADPLHSWPLFE